MKCEVELYVAGQVFTETVHAVNYDEARQVALARNPNARIISCLLYTSPSPRDLSTSRMPSSA